MRRAATNTFTFTARFRQIPVVADLPVGHNLQDHIYPGGVHFTIDKPVSLTQKRIFTLKNLISYFSKGIGNCETTFDDRFRLIGHSLTREFAEKTSAGPLASTGVDGLAFVSTKLVHQDKHLGKKDWPDIEMHMVPADVVADGGRYFKQLAGLSERVSYALRRQRRSLQLRLIDIAALTRYGPTTDTTWRRPASRSTR